MSYDPYSIRVRPEARSALKRVADLLNAYPEAAERILHNAAHLEIDILKRRYSPQAGE